MVCMSTRPGTERLLRVGSRIAGRLASNWYAVYVTRPEDDKGHGDPEAFHRLEEYQRMARDLGAKVVSLSDRNISDALVALPRRKASHTWSSDSRPAPAGMFFCAARSSTASSPKVRDATVQVVPMQTPKQLRKGSVVSL